MYVAHICDININSKNLYLLLLQFDPKQLDGQVISIGSTTEPCSICCRNKVGLTIIIQVHTRLISIPYSF